MSSEEEKKVIAPSAGSMMGGFLEEGFNLPVIEGKILSFWEGNKIFEKTLDKTRDGEPYTFYDGPPFATGLPHYGHILASTIKDVIPRYQTMRGKYVRRRWGWDCHGLPIEEIVERHLGISGKKQIEELGIEKFNATCKDKVLEYVGEWKKMVRRIARWTEFDNSYKTMDRDYMESVWWAFKQFYEKGLIYEGRKVLMYCPRCETPVSNFEVAMDNSYKDVEEEAVTVKFKLKPGQKIGQWETSNSSYVLAWTTTPWTLPGNVALAVGEGIEYVEAKVEFEGKTEFYIFTKDRSEDIIKNIKGKFELFDASYKGSDLIGLEYEQLFDVSAVQNEKTFKVYPADFVTTKEGTGIVHTAVVYGEDDYNLGQKYGLPVVPLLDEKGKFNDKAPESLRGKYFKDADKIVLAELENRKLIFSRAPHTHSYPHCWRCSSPLFYNAIPAWFIDIQKIKGRLVESNGKEINWYPGHLKHGRYEKSVEQAPDWNISRNRYWGNPIPVWKCVSCGENKVVGSIKELGLGRNTFYFSRHGEATTNTTDTISCAPVPGTFDLTEKGVERAKALGERIKKKGGVDLIVASDLLRTRHTAEIVSGILGGAEVILDERLRETNFGPEYNNQNVAKFERDFPYAHRLNNAPPGGESRMQVRARMLDCVIELNRKYEGKKILIVSHGDPLLSLQEHFGSELPWPDFAKDFELDVSIADLHRPYIDQ
ncbi:MAG: class I tRNA ligase family protein, partial [Candidatus Liptonbacteria bacterium]